jgi:hypothetical protein
MDITFCWPQAQDKCGHGLSVSSHVKPKTVAYHLCQITINRVLSSKFEKWCEFSSPIKEKSHKEKLHKMRPACPVLSIRLAWAASGPLIALQNVPLTYTALFSTWLSSLFFLNLE